MPSDQKPAGDAESLRQRLDELETLLAGGGQPSAPGAAPELPVLDDLVVPASTADVPAGDAEPEYRSDADQLAELAGRLEQRICGELEELIGVLRDVVRRQIRQELHDTLRRESDAAEQISRPATPEADSD